MVSLGQHRLFRLRDENSVTTDKFQYDNHVRNDEVIHDPKYNQTPQQFNENDKRDQTDSENREDMLVDYMDSKDYYYDDDIYDDDVIIIDVKPLSLVEQEKKIMEQNTKAEAWEVTKGAGVMGAFAGCLTGSVGMSLLCATGCMYAASAGSSQKRFIYFSGKDDTEVEEIQQQATTTSNVVGDIARACGTLAVTAKSIPRTAGNNPYDEHHAENIENRKKETTKAWRAACQTLKDRAKQMHHSYQYAAEETRRRVREKTKKL